MTKADRHLLGNIMAIGVMTLVFLIGPARRPLEQSALPVSLLQIQSPFSFQAVAALAYDEATQPDSPALRVAKRLRNRLAKYQRTQPPLSALVSAVEEQHALLRKNLSATISLPSSANTIEWNISLPAIQQNSADAASADHAIGYDIGRIASKTQGQRRVI